MAHKKQLTRIVIMSYFAVFLGHSLWRATFYNYGLNELKLDQIQIAALFSVATIPGVFAFMLGPVANRVPLHRLAPFTLSLMSLGLLVLGCADSVLGQMGGVLLLSFGFTWYLPLANNLFIREADKQCVNRRLGLLKSMGPLAATVTTILILIYRFNLNLGTASLFLLSGTVLVVIAWAVGSALREVSYGGSHNPLRVSLRLWPYYLLNAISGSRSALFKSFILTWCVGQLEFTTLQVSVLMLGGSIASVASYLLLGYLAERYNPAKVLSVLYSIVAVIFAAFIVVAHLAELSHPVNHVQALAGGLFLIDSLLFGSSVITDASLKRSTDAEHFYIGDLAFGTTCFHLAGVVLPLLGAWLWLNMGGFSAVLTLGVSISFLGLWASRHLTAMDGGGGGGFKLNHFDSSECR